MKLEEHKTRFFAEKTFAYEAMVDLLFLQGKGDAAYGYAERSKSRSFLYLLGNRKIDPRKSGVPLKLIRREEELREQIVLKSGEMRQVAEKRKTRDVTFETISNEISGLRRELEEVLFKIKLRSEEYASFKNVVPISAEEVRDMLKPDRDTALVEYYVTEKAAYGWVIGADGIRSFEIPIGRDELYGKIRDFQAMAAEKSFGVDALSESAQALYNLLLKPAEPDIGGKSRIGIIPHGELHYLPFEALMKNDKFLPERGIKIFYLPSASAYKYCREKNKFRKEKLIAFGNPDGTLMFSELETRELERLYPDDTEIFTGGKARESNAKKFGQFTDILHFACHGGFNAAKPLYSALMLAPDSQDDGKLEVHEIFEMDLKPAYLVTLSACETHLGDINPGDEIVGLTRAFIYAGTPSILASLWRVDDWYTEKLMVDFYRELKTKDKTDALHTARMKMIGNGKRHPFYWAGFVLIGDYR